MASKSWLFGEKSEKTLGFDSGTYLVRFGRLTDEGYCKMVLITCWPIIIIIMLGAYLALNSTTGRL